MNQISTSHHDFIQGLPKAELHLHIEGSLEPEIMFQLAKLQEVNLPFQASRGIAGPESPWPSDHTGNVTARKDAHDRAAVLAAHAL